MKVYIDMDGVLADFFSEACKLSPTPAAGWHKLGFRDVDKAIDRARKEELFFEKLYMYPEARTLVQSVVNIFGEYHICSSPLVGYEGNCAQEKINWLKKYMHIVPASIEITTDKTKYAKGNILIDDYGHNIRKWEEAGGFGIKYQADEDRVSDALIPLMALSKKF